MHSQHPGEQLHHSKHAATDPKFCKNSSETSEILSMKLLSLNFWVQFFCLLIISAAASSCLKLSDVFVSDWSILPPKHVNLPIRPHFTVKNSVWDQKNQKVGHEMFGGGEGQRSDCSSASSSPDCSDARRKKQLQTVIQITVPAI